MISIKGKSDSAEASENNLDEAKSNEDALMEDKTRESEGSTSQRGLNLQTMEPLHGLSEEGRTSLLKSCVNLIGLPVDADALNAVLRLCLRLTQDFDQAVLFTRLGGIKKLLSLTQASNFPGFISLTTLLIRHVLEDKDSIRHTMEKVVRSSTVNSNSSNTKEFHYLLRMLAPAACRAPDIFAEVAKEVLRVDFSLLNRRGDFVEDTRLLLKSLPPKQASSNATSPVMQEVKLLLLLSIALDEVQQHFSPFSGIAICDL